MDKGIIFDLDGTLWDASHQVVIAWNEALKKCPDIDYLVSERDMQGFMGKTIDVIAKLFFKNVSDERAMEIMVQCLNAEESYIRKHGGTLYPHTEETLRVLSDQYKLAIVSNCQPGYLDAFFEYHQLNKYFCDYESAGRTGLPKGENIRLVVGRNSLEQAVYIGDTKGDYNAARIASIPFIHAAYGFGNIGEETAAVKNISEITNMAMKILK